MVLSILAAPWRHRHSFALSTLVLAGSAGLLLPAGVAAQPAATRGAGARPAGAQSAPLPKGPRAMMLADWYRVVNVSSPAVSPDGKRVAMTVTRAVESENRRHSEVWVVNTAGGEPQRWSHPSWGWTC